MVSAKVIVLLFFIIMVLIIISPILQIKKCHLREVKSLAQGYIANEG